MTTIEVRLGDWPKRGLGNLAPEVIPFWQGLRRHEFPLCTCVQCGAAFWPFTLCPHHDHFVDFEDMEWRGSSGRGTVFANLTVHRVTDEAYAAEVPYTLALVELEEGPLFPTRIVGTAPSDVRIGMEAQVYFYDVDEADLTLPLFVVRR